MTSPRANDRCGPGSTPRWSTVALVADRPRINSRARFNEDVWAKVWPPWGTPTVKHHASRNMPHFGHFFRTGRDGPGAKKRGAGGPPFPFGDAAAVAGATLIGRQTLRRQPTDLVLAGLDRPGQGGLAPLQTGHLPLEGGDLVQRRGADGRSGNQQPEDDDRLDRPPHSD